MTTLNEQINFPSDASLIVRRKDAAHFTFPYHYHRVYELVYVEKGYGKRFVGDQVETFKDGDMVLVAPNLPHCWESDKAFFSNNPELRIQAIVVQFPHDFLGSAVNAYPEFNAVKRLLQQSQRGIRILGETRTRICEKLELLFTFSGVHRILSFVSILDLIAESQDYEFLTSKRYPILNNAFQNTRLSKVLDFIYTNYAHKIKLKEVAAITGLTETGFSLWFKRSTGKNFSGFLNEVRVGKACEHLRTAGAAEIKIARLGYDVGFENLSNFNRVFKRITGSTPKLYRMEFRQMDAIMDSQIGRETFS